MYQEFSTLLITKGQEFDLSPRQIRKQGLPGSTHSTVLSSWLKTSSGHGRNDVTVPELYSLSKPEIMERITLYAFFENLQMTK